MSPFITGAERNVRGMLAGMGGALLGAAAGIFSGYVLGALLMVVGSQSFSSPYAVMVVVMGVGMLGAIMGAVTGVRNARRIGLLSYVLAPLPLILAYLWVGSTHSSSSDLEVWVPIIAVVGGIGVAVGCLAGLLSAAGSLWNALAFRRSERFAPSREIR